VHAQQVAYTLTARVPGASNLTAKNRVWDFFDSPNKARPANRRQPLQLRRKNRPAATKPASGIPYWLSVDPIGEVGELNLYAYVGNDPLNSTDPLGLYMGAPGGEVWHPLTHQGTDEQQKKWGDRAAVTAAAVCVISAAPAVATAVMTKPGLIIAGTVALDETAVVGAGLAGVAGQQLTKGQRLSLIQDILIKLNPKTADQALGQLGRVMDRVEDACSGVAKAVNPVLSPTAECTHRNWIILGDLPTEVSNL
jgi:hypothetical protein